MALNRFPTIQQFDKSLSTRQTSAKIHYWLSRPEFEMNTVLTPNSSSTTFVINNNNYYLIFLIWYIMPLKPNFEQTRISNQQEVCRCADIEMHVAYCSLAHGKYYRGWPESSVCLFSRVFLIFHSLTLGLWERVWFVLINRPALAPWLLVFS